MSDVIIYDRMQERRGTAADLASVNEVLRDGEICVETDTVWPSSGGRKFKIGDGVTAWNSLDYAVPDSSGGVNGGTSFPGSPATNDLFYRTDRSMLYFYDGTQWLTVQTFEVALAHQQMIYPTATAATLAWMPIRQDYGMYLLKWHITTFVGSPNTGSAYWTVALDRFTAANSSTNIASISTSADTQANWVNHDTAINAVLSSSARALRTIGTKTGSPGTIYPLSTISYRLIG